MQQGTTPLHLTAINGHDLVARLLIEHGASVHVKNYAGHNALTIAIMNGKKEVVKAVLDSARWMEALKSAFVSPITNMRETPLRQLVKRYPDLTKMVFNKCMQTNLLKASKVKTVDEERKETAVSPDDPNFSITFNYELLEDSYVLFNEDSLSDSMSLSSLSTVSSSETNASGFNGDGVSGVRPWFGSEIWDENSHQLNPEAQPYSTSATILKMNHPLMIMVKEQRSVHKLHIN